jgi:hypothetical protein
LERTGSIRAETVFSTLTQMIRNEKLLDIDRRAITAGMDFARQAPQKCRGAGPAQTVPGQGATHEITR